MSETEPVVLYMRASTPGQVDRGVSIESQEAELRAYCALRKLTVAEVFTDKAVSGGKPLADRHEGARMLSYLKREGVKHVAVAKLDRAFRDVADALRQSLEWDKQGITLHVVNLGGETVSTASATGKLMLTLLAAVSEFERGLLRERTRGALQHKKANGLRVSRFALYGECFTADGKRTQPDKREQKTIELIRTLSADGLSMRAICAELGKRRIKNREGKTKWHPSTIKTILDNAARQTAKAGKKAV